jgi:hypothetical protein
VTIVLQFLPLGATIRHGHDSAAGKLAELLEFLSEHVLIHVPGQAADKEVLALASTVAILGFCLLSRRLRRSIGLAFLGWSFLFIFGGIGGVGGIGVVLGVGLHFVSF